MAVLLAVVATLLPGPNILKLV